jgi:hypothetical protein
VSSGLADGARKACEAFPVDSVRFWNELYERSVRDVLGMCSGTYNETSLYVYGHGKYK